MGDTIYSVASAFLLQSSRTAMPAFPTNENFNDPLTQVLDVLRPATYMFRALDAGGDWALRYPGMKGLRCYAVTRGAIWMHIDGEPQPRRLEAGSCVVLTREQAFSMGSRIDLPPQDAIGTLATAPWGAVVTINGGGEVYGLGGMFIFESAHASRFLETLPAVMHFEGLPDQARLNAAMEVIMSELREPRLGGRLVAQQTSLSILVLVLRQQLGQSAMTSQGWLQGLGDPKISRALHAVHVAPAERWTLATLAQEAGMSRSAFALHFHQTVGEPAISYLQRWRMLLAADQLQRTRNPIGEIAAQVGYESVSAFSMGFKKFMGQSPRAFRNQ